MCKTGAPCGCSGGPAAPVGLAVAVVLLAAIVSAAAAVIVVVLRDVLVAGGVLLLPAGAYVAYRVRVLTRPSPGPSIDLRKRAAISAKPQVIPLARAQAPLALEAARPRVVPGAAGSQEGTAGPIERRWDAAEGRTSSL